MFIKQNDATLSAYTIFQVFWNVTTRHRVRSYPRSEKSVVVILKRQVGCVSLMKVARWFETSETTHPAMKSHSWRPESSVTLLSKHQNSLLLCSYREYWIINVYYIPTYAQISGIICIEITPPCFGVNTPSSGSLQFVLAQVMNYEIDKIQCSSVLKR